MSSWEEIEGAVRKIAPGLISAAVDDLGSGEDGEKTAESILAVLRPPVERLLAALAAAEAERSGWRRLLESASDFAESVRRIFAHPHFTDRHDDAGRCKRMRDALEAALAAAPADPGEALPGLLREMEDGGDEPAYYAAEIRRKCGLPPREGA